MNVDPVELEKSVADYLDENQVYCLFQDILTELCLHMPDDPTAFITNYLKSTPKMRVFVFGAQGDDVDRLCESAASELGFKLIRSCDFLSSSDIDLSSALKTQAESFESDPNLPGYIISGFPASRAQGRCLQQFWSIIPTRVILIRRQGESENLKLPGIIELFKSVIREFQLLPSSTQESFTSLLKPSSSALAPTRPIRICVTGPSGSGRSTQARLLAAHFGVVFVSASTLALQATGKPFVEGDDGFLAVQRRLEQSDCKRTGWVLEGFPKTKEQATWLKQRWGGKVVCLRVGSETAAFRKPGGAAVLEQISEGISEVFNVTEIVTDGLDIQAVQQAVQEAVEKSN